MSDRSSSFRIPFATDPQGILTSPATAVRKTPYTCPVCSASVNYRHGPKVSPHFAHKSSQNCHRETVIHQTAKQLIAQSVQDWLSGRGRTPGLIRSCTICSQQNHQDIEGPVGSVQIEYQLPSGYVVDVALLNGDEVVLAIEIRVSHAVDIEKARSIGVPFVELDGYEVTHSEPPRSGRGSTSVRPRSSPTDWSPVQTNVSQPECVHCQNRLTKFMAKAVSVAAACGLEIPKSYYRPGICRCWKCNKEIVVFAWPGSGQWKDSEPALHEQRPLNIRHRHTRMSDSSYWLNVCPYCDEVQGDYFLFLEPGGPFFGLKRPLGVFVEDYESDLVRIASRAADEGIIDVAS